MNRPKILHIGGTVYWVLRTYDPDTMVLKDADSTPTVVVRKNGSSVGDSVTITKRSATTGIYDCSYNPASEIEGDKFTIEESATVTGTTTGSATYTASWEFTVMAVERGTDSAALASGVNVTQLGGDTQSLTDLKDFADAGYDPATNKVQGVVLVDTLTTYTGNTVQTGDAFSRIGLAGVGLSNIPWNNTAWDAEVQSEVVDALAAFWTSPATLVDLVWDEILTGATHNITNSAGKRLRQVNAFQQTDGTVNDAGATATSFVTDLASSVDNFYNDSMLVFTDGALAGQVRAITGYVGETKTITLEEALTSAPANGVAFTIVSIHIHPVSQIQSGLATQSSVDTIDNLLDTEMPALTLAVANLQTSVNTIDDLLDTEMPALTSAVAAVQTDLTTTMLWTKRNAVILTGIISSAGTATEVFTVSSLGITATVSVDASGNRSAVVWS